MPKEAVFIEPEASVLGPGRQKEQLKLLCDDLASARPREPIDGILLVVNLADFIDLDERGQEDYANGIRRYLVEINERLRVDVPVYVLLTRYDAIWGFAEVFQWTPERKREDPWGFTLPYDTESQNSLPRIKEQLDGLNARIEAFCLAKLCSEDPPEQRIRGFQHLAEVRVLMEKLKAVFQVVAMTNAFERAPWIRAVALGSALPGAGDRLRAGVARFFNMGYGQGPNAPAGRPGGLPIHQYLSTVILPERDIVPLRTRWREDKIIQLCMIFAALLWVGTIITGVIFAVSAPPSHKVGVPLPPKTAPKR
jgi:type VI secretion system protein ImpL